MALLAGRGADSKICHEDARVFPSSNGHPPPCADPELGFRLVLHRHLVRYERCSEHLFGGVALACDHAVPCLACLQLSAAFALVKRNGCDAATAISQTGAQSTS